MIAGTNCLKSQIVAAAKTNNKWGFIDTSGSWIIHPQFDSVSNFYNGYAEFRSDSKFGMINHKGEIIIPANYEFVGLAIDDMVLLLNNDMVGYYNVKTNLIIQPQYEDGNDFSEGLAAVMGKSEKWGLINTEGEIVLSFKYDYLDEFENGRIQAELGEKEYFINKKGRTVKPIKVKNELVNELTLDEKRIRLKTKNVGFDTLNFPATGYRQNNLFWYQTDKKYGIADTSGKIITYPIYDYLWYFSEELAPVNLNGKWGFIDSHGDVRIELRFEKVSNFKFRLAPAKMNGKWGFINHYGNWIIPPTFEDTDGYFKNVFAKFDPIVTFEYR